MNKKSGFSLVEMAVVLGIIAILVASLLGPLGTQEEIRRIKETERRIANIKQSLIGFAIANGRLPCPSTAATNGVEVATNADCGAGNYDGFIPAVTLSITPVNDQGFAIDAWGNEFRYSVANISIFDTIPPIDPTVNFALTVSNSIRDAEDLSAAAVAGGLLQACSAGCTNQLANSIAAVVYSLGPNNLAPGTSNDEFENTDGNGVFVETTPRDIDDLVNGEFDDVVDWISISTLFERMAEVGQIPN